MPVLLLFVCTFFMGSQGALADSATWRTNPSDSFWNNAANWTPATVPNGPNDIATFQASSQQGISTGSTVNGIIFNAGAPSFLFAGGFTIGGTGIVNNSGVTQRFYAGVGFSNSASAGTNTLFNASVQFHGTSTAANGTFNNAASFYDSSTAESATFNGQACFSNQATVGTAAFNGGACFADATTANNAIISGGAGFTDNSSAMDATLIANNGQTISFSGNSTGDRARVEVFGSGKLDISAHALPGVEVASIEGNGNILLGFRTLTVGTNNTSTTFSGVASGIGFLTKTGTGTLTLTGSNTYAGSTTINNGILRASADQALGGSPQNFGYVNVGSGAALTLDSGATNNYIANRNTLLLVAGSIVNLNFSGNPDRVRSLIVDGLTQAPGLYGGPASGAPNQLPQFTGTGQVLSTLKAVSRKVHGDAGSFDIDLPVTGPPGIECRSGGTNGDYQIVISCFNNVTFSGASVLMGTGHVVNSTGNGTNTLTVNVQLANAQVIQLIISDFNDSTGATNLIIPMGVLVGDVNDNRVVNASDVAQVKAQLGPVTASNFRADINANGGINASDIIQAKSQSGTFLP